MAGAHPSVLDGGGGASIGGGEQRRIIRLADTELAHWPASVNKARKLSRSLRLAGRPTNNEPQNQTEPTQTDPTTGHRKPPVSAGAGLKERARV